MSFDKFKHKGKEIERVAPLPKRKRGLPYNKNYRKRMEKDRHDGLHHKMLKYRKVLHREVKEVLKEQWVKDLGVDSANEMFIYAVTRGFIKGEFNNE